MPRLNPVTGEVVAGIGQGTVSIDRHAIAVNAGQADWLDRDEVLYQAERFGKWGLYANDGDAERVLDPKGANELAGGGSIWAAWTPDGLRSNLHPPMREAGLKGVGPDGTLAYCLNRQDGKGLVLRATGGSTITLSMATVRDVHVLTSTDAVWIEGGRIRSTIGHPKCLEGRVGVPRAILLPSGAQWLIYFHAKDGLERLLLQQWDLPVGKVLAEGRPLAAFRPDAVALNDATARIVYATNEAETPSSVVIQDVALTTATDDLRLPVTFEPLPAMEAGCFFSDSARYGSDPEAPGNCTVIVETGLHPTKPVILARLADTGHDLIHEYQDRDRWRLVRAVYVTSERGQLADEARRARERMDELSLPHRPIVSYTGPRQIVMAEVDWTGVELYPNPGESVPSADRRWRAAIAATGARDVALFCGAFDRSGQIDEATLDACLTLYPEIARSLGARCKALLLFSWGRPGGLADHQRLQPLALAVLSACGTPKPYPASQEKPHITIASYTPTAGKPPLRVRAVRELSGGHADTIKWRFRAKGAQGWTLDAVNPAADKDHHFMFYKTGTWEIGCDVSGPGGTDGTSKSRVVKVGT